MATNDKDNEPLIEEEGEKEITDNPKKKFSQNKFQAKTSFGQLLDVQDQPHEALTDCEDVDGSDSDDGQLEPYTHEDILILDLDFNCKIKKESSDLKDHDPDTPDDDGQTDNEEFQASSDDDDIGHYVSPVMSERLIVQTDQSSSVVSQSRITNKKFIAAQNVARVIVSRPINSTILKKRSALKKLGAVDEVENNIPGLNPLTTDVECLSRSDTDIRENGGETVEIVEASSESEDTEHEELSDNEVDNSSSKIRKVKVNRDFLFVDVSEQGPDTEEEDEVFLDEVEIQESEVETDYLVVSDAEVQNPGFSRNIPQRHRSQSLPNTNKLRLVPDVDEGLTDVENMSGGSDEEDNLVIDVELADYPSFNEDVSSKELEKVKSVDEEGPLTDEEDAAGSDFEAPERQRMVVNEIEPEENVVKAGESFGRNHVLSHVSKLQPLQMSRSRPEILTSPEEAEDEGNNTDEEVMTDFGGVQRRESLVEFLAATRDTGFLETLTDTEYVTGSEEEGELLSLQEFLTTDGGQWVVPMSKNKNTTGKRRRKLKPHPSKSSTGKQWTETDESGMVRHVKQKTTRTSIKIQDDGDGVADGEQIQVRNDFWIEGGDPNDATASRTVTTRTTTRVFPDGQQEVVTESTAQDDDDLRNSMQNILDQFMAQKQEEKE